MSLWKRHRDAPARPDRCELPVDEHHEVVVLAAGPGGGLHGCRPGPVELELRRDPRSPHAPEAVGVLLAGEVIGHLPRSEAEEYWPVLAGIERRGSLVAAGVLQPIADGGLEAVVLLPEASALRRWAEGGGAGTDPPAQTFPRRAVD